MLKLNAFTRKLVSNATTVAVLVNLLLLVPSVFARKSPARATFANVSVGFDPAQAPNQPEFKLPLPESKDWLLSVEVGGKYYAGGRDTNHAGRSKYALDFLNNTAQDGELEGRLDVDILAAASGTVVEVVDGWDQDRNCKCFGNYVKIDHGSGYTTIVGHLKKGSIPLNIFKGRPVARGQKLGVMGTSGNSSGTHVHFEIRYNNEGDTQSTILDQVMVDGMRMIDYKVGNTKNPTYYQSTNTAFCGNGDSERYQPANGIPIHPEGTLIKVPDDGTESSKTIFVLRDGIRRPIANPQVLWELYGPGRGFDFRDVITIAQDEMGQYPEGEIVSSPLPNNDPFEPNGRLIRQRGGSEISIVTGYKFRRPFSTEAAFLGLGYLYCNVATVDNYKDYDAGPFVEEFDGGGAIDEFGPNLAITSHSNGQTVTTSAITISGTASDAGRGDSGISSVTVNGVSASGGAVAGSDTVSWSQNVNLNLGANTITVIATDNSVGRNQTTQSITITSSPQASRPAVSSISPNPVPTFNANQNVNVSGSSFQSGLVVDVFNSSGVKLATLSGSQVLNVTTSSFTMVVNLGSSASTFGIEVVNPDGGRSSRFTFSTTAANPSVSSISPNPPPVVNGNQNVAVNGSSFQFGLIVDVFNSSGTKVGTLSGTQILNVKPSSFTMVINLGSTAGTFGMEVVNPNGGRSPRFTFSTR
jgi:murein DD-endopeptidase MepM/ murein hydrolase activator NlpD